jgi:hypothetical protein
MDEVAVEGEPIFQSVKRTMKDDTDHVLFTGPNLELCKHILEDIKMWTANKFEHSDDPTAYHENYKKIFSTTTEQHKNQHHVKFGAYTNSLVKKLCAVNPNEATGDFDYAPSRPEIAASPCFMQKQLHHPSTDQNLQTL